MSTRLYHMAREYHRDFRQMLALARAKGLDIPSHLSVLEEDQVTRLRESFGTTPANDESSPNEVEGIEEEEVEVAVAEPEPAVEEIVEAPVEEPEAPEAPVEPVAASEVEAPAEETPAPVAPKSEEAQAPPAPEEATEESADPAEKPAETKEKKEKKESLEPLPVDPLETFVSTGALGRIDIEATRLVKKAKEKKKDEPKPVAAEATAKPKAGPRPGSKKDRPSGQGPAESRPRRRFIKVDRRRPTGMRRKGKKSSEAQEFIPTNVEISLPITIKDLSAQIGIKVNLILGKLMELGVIGVNINSSVADQDTVELLASEFDREVKFKATTDVETSVIAEFEQQDKPEDLSIRAPVVTFLGHVDHGKTSLLDRIRNADVAGSEHGGITQHIGAYRVESKDRRPVVFLDTPGHEKFTEMRARGAHTTDVVVLVVAADDGVMPQTEEAINHARAAEVPIVVALNKIDKANANPDRVKQELTNLGLQPEEWGGKTVVQPVSAIKGDGVDDLIEYLSLEADLLELQANPNKPGVGTVIEAQRHEGRGVVANVLIQDGTLRRGDNIVCGRAHGRARIFLNDKGLALKEAGPSTPISISGLSDLPEPGDRLYVVKDGATAKAIAEERVRRHRETELSERNPVTLENLFDTLAKEQLKELRIVLKADVKGSEQVLRKSLTDLSTEEIKVVILHSAVGGITEADIQLADASSAIVLGFHVLADDRARSLAEERKIEIRTYQVIYKAIEEVRAAMEGLLEPEEIEKIVGQVEIRNTFKISRVGTIAGCYMKNGKIKRSSRIRVYRDGGKIYEGVLDSLKRFKDDVREVEEGHECGLKVKDFDDIKVGDTIEAFEIEKIKRTLS